MRLAAILFLSLLTSFSCGVAPSPQDSRDDLLDDSATSVVESELKVSDADGNVIGSLVGVYENTNVTLVQVHSDGVVFDVNPITGFVVGWLIQFQYSYYGSSDCTGHWKGVMDIPESLCAPFPVQRIVSQQNDRTGWEEASELYVYGSSVSYGTSYFSSGDECEESAVRCMVELVPSTLPTSFPAPITIQQ